MLCSASLFAQTSREERPQVFHIFIGNENNRETLNTARSIYGTDNVIGIPAQWYNHMLNRLDSHGATAMLDFINSNIQDDTVFFFGSHITVENIILRRFPGHSHNLYHGKVRVVPIKMNGYWLIAIQAHRDGGIRPEPEGNIRLLFPRLNDRQLTAKVAYTLKKLLGDNLNVIQIL